MPRHYERKAEDPCWTEEIMKEAISLLLAGENFSQVSRATGIPRSTLQKRLKLIKTNNEVSFSAVQKGRKPVFTAEHEQELMDVFISYELDLCGVTSDDARAIAYQLAEKYKLKHNFSPADKMAGEDWLAGFQSAGLVSGERGEHVTAVICFSAAGVYMPPVFIFPKKKSHSKYFNGLSEGASIEFHERGYMQKEIFYKWLQKFIEFTKPTSEKKVLLLLDGHSSHVQNLAAIQLARENNVIMLVSPPPHCTHKLQPVDICFNKPLSTFIASEHTIWIRRQRGNKLLNLSNLFEVVTPAYNKAATAKTAIKAYDKAGICPLNKNKFTEEDFAHSVALCKSYGPSNSEFRNSILEVMNSLGDPSGNTDSVSPITSNDGFNIEEMQTVQKDDINDSFIIEAPIQNNELLTSDNSASISKCDSVINTSLVERNESVDNLEVPCSELALPYCSESNSVITSESVKDSHTSPTEQEISHRQVVNNAQLTVKGPIKYRSRKGRAVVLTDDEYIQELNDKQKLKQKPRSRSKAAKESTQRKFAADITNNQLTAVNLQLCTPYPAYPQGFFQNLMNYSTVPTAASSPSIAKVPPSVSLPLTPPAASFTQLPPANAAQPTLPPFYVPWTTNLDSKPSVYYMQSMNSMPKGNINSQNDIQRQLLCSSAPLNPRPAPEERRHTPKITILDFSK